MPLPTPPTKPTRQGFARQSPWASSGGSAWEVFCGFSMPTTPGWERLLAHPGLPQRVQAKQERRGPRPRAHEEESGGDEAAGGPVRGQRSQAPAPGPQLQGLGLARRRLRHVRRLHVRQGQGFILRWPVQGLASRTILGLASRSFQNNLVAKNIQPKYPARLLRQPGRGLHRDATKLAR